MPHMPSTGVSGVDLYRIDEKNCWTNCFTNYSFGDTIVYTYQLKHEDSGKLCRYCLYLPLYNGVKWMQIGVPENARFEFAAAASDGSRQLIVYMHQTRFAAEMPAVEMRIPAIGYTGEGNAVSFSVESIVPEALIAAAGSYQPMERYRLTGVNGTIDGIICRVRFVCAGEYRVDYEGALLINEMIGENGAE